MIVKLQLGYLEPIKEQLTETPAFLDRRVLVVYTGNHESMDGLVEVKNEHIERLAEKRNSLLSKIQRLASGELPVHVCPPIQLDHSVSAKDTIGRVVGNYEVGDFEVEPGDRRKALFTTLRFLGKENVEKSIDGRYHHVSFGGDLETGDTQEISVTPFPAAEYAQLLSKKKTLSEKFKGHDIVVTQGEGLAFYFEVKGHKAGPFQKEEDALEQARQYVEGLITSEKLTQGDHKMPARLKAYIMRLMKLSEKDAEKKLAEMPEADKAKMAEEEKKDHERLKGYLTGFKKMSEPDAEKHLSEMDTDKKKELAAEADEHEKKLAAEKTDEEKAKMSRLSAARVAADKLSTDFRASAEKAKLAGQKVKILTRLSQLKSQAKITPAEIKKIELDKLAANSDATIDAVLKTYSDREPVIPTGILGSTSGASFSKAHKQIKMSQLEAETRANMPLMAQQTKNRLAAEGADGKVKSDPAVQAGEPSFPQHMSDDETAEAHKQLMAHMSNVHAAMDAGKPEEAKEHLKRLMEHAMKHMTSPAHMSENEEAHKADVEMSALAENAKTMQTKFEEAMALVSGLVGGDTK